jgi:hypothetical protein
VAEHVRMHLVEPRMRDRLLLQETLDQLWDLLAHEDAEQTYEGDDRWRRRAHVDDGIDDPD